MIVDEYLILTAHSPGQLETRVNQSLKKGRKLYGHPFVADPGSMSAEICQCVIVPATPNNNIKRPRNED